MEIASSIGIMLVNDAGAIGGREVRFCQKLAFGLLLMNDGIFPPGDHSLPATDRTLAT